MSQKLGEAIPEQGAQSEEVGTDLEERVQNIEAYLEKAKPSTLWETIKQGIKTFFIPIVLFGISAYIVGIIWAIIISVFVFPLTYFYTKYIYKPSIIPVMVVGHEDETDLDSMIVIQLWGIPKQLWDTIKTKGIVSMLKTQFGVSYLAESFQILENGDIHIIFSWGHNPELEFLDKHAVFHYLNEQYPNLKRINNFYRLTIKAITEGLAYDYAELLTKVISNEVVNHGKLGKQDEDMLDKAINDLTDQIRTMERKKKKPIDVISEKEANLIP